jgi:hypothetical protein
MREPSGIGAERIGRPAARMSRLSDERPGTDDTFRLGEDWHSKAINGRRGSAPGTTDDAAKTKSEGASAEDSRSYNFHRNSLPGTAILIVKSDVLLCQCSSA